ncbi:hypothetical protein BDW68DRAFT_108273 [Aspergillus falconensis]
MMDFLVRWGDVFLSCMSASAIQPSSPLCFPPCIIDVSVRCGLLLTAQLFTIVLYFVFYPPYSHTRLVSPLCLSLSPQYHLILSQSLSGSSSSQGLNSQVALGSESTTTAYTRERGFLNRRVKYTPGRHCHLLTKCPPVE